MPLRVVRYGPSMLLLFTLLACTTTATSSLDVQTFDCVARCWQEAAIPLPDRYWREWSDGEACDDGGFYMVYEGECVQTTRIYGSSWTDDPAVEDASGCCSGVGDEELQTAPLCLDTAR